MEFYKTVFGGKLDMTTFKDGMAGMPMEESEEVKIMHAQLVADNGIVFMAADTPAAMEFHAGGQISMSLSGDNESELRGYWEKLSEGGTVAMPLEKAPWGDTFGMVNDKFGVYWMVNISGHMEKM
jgi:PhnB protein